MLIDKKRLLKNAGWTFIVAGAYMVYLGSMYDDVVTRMRPDDNVIDAEFFVVDED